MGSWSSGKTLTRLCCAVPPHCTISRTPCACRPPAQPCSTSAICHTPVSWLALTALLLNGARLVHQAQNPLACWVRTDRSPLCIMQIPKHVFNGKHFNNAGGAWDVLHATAGPSHHTLHITLPGSCQREQSAFRLMLEADAALQMTRAPTASTCRPAPTPTLPSGSTMETRESAPRPSSPSGGRPPRAEPE